MGETNFDGREWETHGERGSLLAGEGWRYAQDGGVRHHTEPLRTVFDRGQRMSACGLVGETEYWRGTGSQGEYERLATMPKCLRCMKIGKL